MDRPVRELQPNLPTRVPSTQIPPAAVNMNTNAIKPPQTGDSQTGKVKGIIDVHGP